MPLSFRLAVLGACLATPVAGGYPSLQNDRYFQYQLVIEVDGQRQAFQQDFA